MNNLKYYRKKANYTQGQLAEYLGLSTTAYGHYETGRRQIPIDNLMRLSDLYGVSTDDLLGRNGTLDNIVEKPELVPEEEVMIPLVASLRCGYGSNGNGYAFIKPIPVPKSYVRRWGEGLQCIMAVGDSMSPTIIPGDKLVCRPGEAWEDGQVVVVNINDSDTVKRIYRAPDGGIDLKPDNPDFDTMHFSPDDIDRLQIHILGRVMIPIGKEL